MVQDILHYTLARQEELASVGLEDVALCGAYYESLAESPHQQSAHAVLPGLIEDWVRQPFSAPVATCGRRQQLLLRVLIDALESLGVEHLSRDEVRFLVVAHDLAGRKQGCGRVRDLLAPHVEPLVQRRDKLHGAPGLTQITNRVRMISPERIEKSPRRPAHMFPGDARTAPSPTLEVSGPARVLGSIPDDCTLIVAGGKCSVDGYVLGRLSVSDDCDIRENIGGWVVANTGDIRCRNVIEKATAIAKCGNVQVVQAMGPAIVFAGREISACDSISRGKYAGTRITVRNKVTGGEIHVSEKLVADYLEPAEAAPLNIVLRSELTCEDYGEQVGPEVLRVKARAAYLRRKLSHLGHMVRATQAEAEHAASTAVLRAFSDTPLMAIIEERAHLARRLAVLNRLVSVMHELYCGAEEVLAAPQTSGEEESPLILSDVEADLDELAREGQVDQDLNQERLEIKELYTRLGWTSGDHRALLGMMSILRDRMEPWVVERQLVKARLERLTSEVTRAVPEAEMDSLARRAHAAREPKLAILQRKIMALKQNPPNDEIKRRLQTPLVLLMINVMQRRIYRLNELGASIIKCKQEQAAVAAELRRHYSLGAPEAEGPPSASGRFAPGVRIYRDAYLIGEPNPLPGTVVTTTGNEKVMTYTRDLANIVAAPGA